MLVVDPKWVEEASEEVKSRLLSVMMKAEPVVKKYGKQQEYHALKKCHPNAWTPPFLKDILSGTYKKDSTGSIFFCETLFTFGLNH